MLQNLENMFLENINIAMCKTILYTICVVICLVIILHNNSKIKNDGFQPSWVPDHYELS